MGALLFLLYNSGNSVVTKEFTESFMKMKRRGPDATKIFSENTIEITKLNEEQIKLQLSKREISEYSKFNFITGYHRLSVNDLTLDGEQPFEDPIMNQILKNQELRKRPKRKLICNGEIYNYNELRNIEKFTETDLQSECDVEIILPMYIKYGLEETLKRMNGDYSFVLTENLNTFNLKSLNAYVVRDVLGMKPLYMVKGLKNTFYMFVSELKSIPKSILNNTEYQIKEVPPGTYWSFQNSVINKNKEEFIRYSDWNYYKNLDNCTISEANPDNLSKIYNDINKIVTDSVIKRFNSSHRNVGFLLSGGFDSSILLSITLKYLVEKNHDFEKNPIHVFTMGDSDNKDVKSAKTIVTYLQTQYSIKLHHHIVSIHSINDKDILEYIKEVIYNIESYDLKTIKNALPYIFLFKYISKHTDISVLLSGEGLNELCGYHKFFTLSDEMFQKKSVKLIKHMSKYSLLRCDKMAGALGLELRHPFLDKEFLEYILSIHPKLKKPQTYNHLKSPIEKYIIRKAFDNYENHKYLPNEILWRSLQESSKCFGFMEERIKKWCEEIYTDSSLFDYSKSKVSDNRIKTKEEMHVYKLYKDMYCKTIHLIPDFWEKLWDN